MTRSIAAAYGIAGLFAAVAAIAVLAPLPDRAAPTPTEQLDLRPAPEASTPSSAAQLGDEAQPRAARAAGRTSPRTRAASAVAPEEEVLYVDERGRPIDPRMASAAPRWEEDEDEDDDHEEREHSRRGGHRERDED